MAKRALLLVNRKSRRGQENLEAIRNRLTEGGLELVEPDSESGDPSELIRQHAAEVELVVVGGGDGSIHLALPGLVDTQLSLGVLPLGTANDLARSLELPLDPVMACEVILEGNAQRIDLGKVNDQWFMNVASLGLSTEVTDRLTRGAKSRWGVFAYLFATMGALVKGRPFKVEIICDGETYRSRSWQVAVGNGRSYGGGLTINEHAEIDDGILDLYSLEVEQGWHLITMVIALWRGTLDPLHNVRTLRGTKIEVRSLRRRRHITADGEMLGKTPARFEIVPAAITVFRPQPAPESEGWL